MFPEWNSSAQVIFAVLPPFVFAYKIVSITLDFDNLTNGIIPLQVSSTALGKVFMLLQKGKDL